MPQDILAGLLEEVEDLFLPLEEAAREPDLIFKLLRRLGWEVDDLVPAATTLSSSFGSIIKALDQVRSVAGNGSPDFGAVAQALRESSTIPDAVKNLRQQMEAALPAVANDLATLPVELLEMLFVDWMRRRCPLAFTASVAAGLIEPQIVSERLNTARRVLRQPVMLIRLRFERLSQWITDPLGQVRTRFGVESLVTEADARAYAMRVFPLVANLMLALGAEPTMGRGPGLCRLSDQDELALAHILSVHWQPPFDDAVAANIGVNIAALSAAEAGPGIMFMPFGTTAFNVTGGGWTGRGELGGTVDALFLKPSGAEFPGGGTAEFVGALQVVRSGANNRFGSANGTRLELGDVSFKAQFRVTPTARELGALLDISKAGFFVSGGDGDGFLQQVLPKDGLHMDFDLAIGWSNTRGLYVRGGAGLEATLPIHKELLGVLKVDSVYLALRTKGVDIEAVAAATASISLGPLKVTVERMGLRALVTFPQSGGNLGVVNLELGFKPPNGAGLTINAGIVVGGGYLFFDEQKQQYAGVVQLEIAEILNITAVGLITTQMPDGSPGFSLLVLIAAQFSPPIQLGYGFTLNGLGGLLGVNRTAAVDVLRAGLRSGTLGSVLFPVDPVHNAARIVSDLGAVFPPAEGRFVFGPMAILGWGPKTLIMLQLGLVLELPEPVRLLILGRLLVVLPEEKHAVVRLQLDSLGVIDFATGDVSLDAVLYDSEIKGFTITGEMALRANFGASPGFLVAVGGFHPAFKAPTGFPSLQRVAISLATGDNPRLRLAAYMALTTNTVQFGALLDLYARLGEFSVEGHLGFDALIQFNPFGLVASLGAMVAVKSSGRVLLGVMLDMGLTGPTPWHAWGKARFQILLFPVTVEFSVQVGEAQPPSLPAPVQLRPLLREALEDPHNWATQLPRGEHPLVVLRAQPQGTAMLVHPLADLQVSQRVVPLECKITRFGNTVPEGERRFSLGIVDRAGEVRTEGVGPVCDFFAPAQFHEMSDDEKLSAPAFEKHPSGIRFAMQGYDCGTPVVEDEMLYEESTIPATAAAGVPGAVASAVPAAAPLMAEPYALTTAFVTRVTPTGAVGLAPLHHTGRAKYRVAGVEEAPGFRLKPRGYTIAGGGPSKRYESYLAAVDALRERQALRPQEKARLRVVPD